MTLAHEVYTHKHTMSNTSTIDPLEAESQAVSTNTFVLEHGGLGGEARFVLHVTEDFFEDFFVGVLYIVAIASIAALITWGAAKAWRLGFGNCGCRMSCVRVSQTFLIVTLMIIGIMLAFGSVGVSFPSIFSGISIVVAGWVISMSKLTTDFLDGLRLISLGVLEDHHKIRATHLDLEGEILSVGYFSTEISREITTSNIADTVPSTNYRQKTTIIRNSLLLDGPLDVWWHTERDNDRTISSSSSKTTAHRERSSSRFDTVDVEQMRAQQAIEQLSRMGGSSISGGSLSRRLVAAANKAGSQNRFSLGQHLVVE